MVSASDCGVRGPRFKSRSLTVVFSATAAAIYSLELSNNNNGDGGWGRQLPIIGGLTAQVDWLGLRVDGHPALSLHSSDEPGELSQ